MHFLVLKFVALSSNYGQSKKSFKMVKNPIATWTIAFVKCTSILGLKNPNSRYRLSKILVKLCSTEC